MSEIDSQTKAKLIVETALELRAEQPVSLDMHALTSFADTFVILTGRSDRQVRSIADAIIQALKRVDEAPLGVEGLDDGKWVLIDCNDAIVHVFDPETRIQYDLERLWRDAPRIDLGIPGVDPNPGDPRPASTHDDPLSDAAVSAAVDPAEEEDPEAADPAA